MSVRGLPTGKTKWRPGWPRLQRDWIGLRVESKRRMSNCNGSVPAGRHATILSVFRGTLYLEFEKCSACGCDQSMNRVSHLAVDLLP